MRLLRPYISYAVRETVVLRQLAAASVIPNRYIKYFGSAKARVTAYLGELFGGEPAQLDHDPALQNRPFDNKTQKYTPDANDPEYLIYRTKQAHKIKTLVRGDGAQLSDAAIARKRKRQRRERRHKWPSRELRSASHWPRR